MKMRLLFLLLALSGFAVAHNYDFLVHHSSPANIPSRSTDNHANTLNTTDVVRLSPLLSRSRPIDAFVDGFNKTTALAIRHPRAEFQSNSDAMNYAAVSLGVVTAIVTPLCGPCGAVTGIAAAALAFFSWIEANNENNQKSREELKKQEEILSKLTRIENLLEDINGTVRINKMKLEQLHEALKSFERKSDANFAKLIELQYIQEVIRPIKVLEDFMWNAIITNGTENKNQFTTQYKSDQPFGIISKLFHMLDDDRTNPIRKTMANNIFKSPIILANYVYEIVTAVFKTMAIETIYCDLGNCGIGEEKSKFLEGRLSAINSFVVHFNSTLESYKLQTEKYFNNIISEEVNKLNTDESDVVKRADLIKQLLDGIYTNDRFTITVFNRELSSSFIVPIGEYDIREMNGISRAQIRTMINTTSIQMFEHIPTESLSIDSTVAVIQRSSSFIKTDNRIGSLRARIQQIYSKYKQNIYKTETQMDFVGHIGKNDPYLSHMGDLIPELTAFVTWDVIPVVRYSKNGKGIIEQAYLHCGLSYYGIAWK